MTCSLVRVNLNDMTSSNVLSWQADNQRVIAFGDTIVCCNVSANRLETRNYVSGEQRVVSEQALPDRVSAASVNIVDYDNGKILLSYSAAQSGARSFRVFDQETGECQDWDLSYSSYEHTLPVTVAAKTPDAEYLVICGEEEQANSSSLYLNSGTAPVYALISQEDYWAGRASYRYIS